MLGINRYKPWVLAATCVLFALQGCNGGSDSSNDQSETTTPNDPIEEGVKHGVFLDSPVEGLSYIAGTKSGITDRHGQFTYEDGETVYFYIGDIFVGEAPSAPTITPIDLVPEAIDKEHPTVTNIARFLQTLDDDADPSNGISITEIVRANAAGSSIDFNLAIEDFESDGNVQTTVSNLTSATQAGSRLLIPADVALENLHSALFGTSIARCLSPPCIRITKIWSDQFPGVVANFYPGGSGKRGGNYIVVGAQENDGRVHIKANISIEPPELISKVRVRFTPEFKSPSLPSPVGTGSINSSGDMASISFNPPLFNAAPHYIVAWIDEDSDDHLDLGESFTLSDGYIHPISKLRYNTMKNELFIGGIAELLRLQAYNAIPLLRSFLSDKPPNDASDEFDTKIHLNVPDHNVGAIYDPITLTGSIRDHFYKSNHPLTRAALHSTDIATEIKLALGIIKDERLKHCICDPNQDVYQCYIEVNLSDRPRFTSTWDLFYTFGSADFVHLKLTAYIYKNSGELKSVDVEGYLSDLYDFWWKEDGFINRHAASVQAGYDTKGKAGHIFRTVLEFNGSSLLQVGSSKSSFAPIR
ncbi:MAG: hypothetical protein M3H12_07585 [Chromatiales bacterium]|nr:hypothetical protein [Gammaproteobacteria bacterium]